MNTAAKFSGPVCRGSWSLGTACGKCERCKATRPTDTQAPDVVVTEARVIYIRWSDDGQHIRKWDTKPFDGAEPMYSRSWLLSEERVEAATRGMTPLLCGTQEDELGNEIPDKQFNQLTPDWQNAFRRYARAALSSAIGQPEAEFSGWVEVVEEGE